MEKLYLGIGRRDITPKIGARLFGYQDNVYSTCVNDNLYTNAFVFKQGGEYTAIIRVSVCLMDTDLCDSIRKKIEAEHNIPYSAIMISTTHTHSGPYTASGSAVGRREDDYCDGVLTPAIVGAVGDALENIEATEDDINGEYENIANAYGVELDQVKASIDAAAIAADMKVKKAMDLVKEKAAIKVKAPAKAKAATKSTTKSTTTKTTKKASTAKAAKPAEEATEAN